MSTNKLTTNKIIEIAVYMLLISFISMGVYALTLIYPVLQDLKTDLRAMENPVFVQQHFTQHEAVPAPRKHNWDFNREVEKYA